MKDIVILVALEEELPKGSLKEFHIEYTGVDKHNRKELTLIHEIHLLYCCIEKI